MNVHMKCHMYLYMVAVAGSQLDMTSCWKCMLCQAARLLSWKLPGLGSIPHEFFPYHFQRNYPTDSLKSSRYRNVQQTVKCVIVENNQNLLLLLGGTERLWHWERVAALLIKTSLCCGKWDVWGVQTLKSFVAAIIICQSASFSGLLAVAVGWACHWCSQVISESENHSSITLKK